MGLRRNGGKSTVSQSMAICLRISKNLSSEQQAVVYLNISRQNVLSHIAVNVGYCRRRRDPIAQSTWQPSHRHVSSGKFRSRSHFRLLTLGNISRTVKRALLTAGLEFSQQPSMEYTL